MGRKKSLDRPQLPLFEPGEGGPDPAQAAGADQGVQPPGPQPVEPEDEDPPAPDHEALVALAARLPALVRLGTSSWTFEGWQGLKRRFPGT